MKKFSLALTVVILTLGGIGCSTPKYPNLEEEVRSTVPEEIEANRGKFSDCYAIRPRPRKEGTVRVTFAYGKTGEVASASVVETTLGDPEVENCVLKTIRGIRFKAVPRGGDVVVTYPFNFNSPAKK